MKISEVVKEDASCGGTSSGSIATNMSPQKSPPKGQFFGGDPNTSIYKNSIKKHRAKRKKCF